MEFGDFSKEYTDKTNALIHILPVPYDKTSTWIKGADKGPEAICKASFNLEFYDIETRKEVFKKGIHTLKPVTVNDTPENLVEEVKQQVKKIAGKKKFPVIIGGNHTVSIGAINAMAESYRKMSVLQLDAHTDLRNEYEGSKFNHACAMARACEVSEVMQVGIRSMDRSEVRKVRRSRIIYAEQYFENKVAALKKILRNLNKNVYITIDLDVFDPSLIPSTGTPEPGGFMYYDVLDIVRKVIRYKNVVGFDIVELCPNENNKAPDFVAAKLLYQMLSFKFR